MKIQNKSKPVLAWGLKVKKTGELFCHSYASEYEAESMGNLYSKRYKVIRVKITEVKTR